MKPWAHMNVPRVKRVVVVLVGLSLILIALKPVPPTKARAQRIHAVNHVANITIPLPSTNVTVVPISKK